MLMTPRTPVSATTAAAAAAEAIAVEIAIAVAATAATDHADAAFATALHVAATVGNAAVGTVAISQNTTCA